MNPPPAAAFTASRGDFEALAGFLGSEECLAMEHAALESALEVRGRELLRRMLQDHLDLRALREERLGDVRDDEHVQRTRVEAGHSRSLETVFGEVQVRRLAYRAAGQGNLHPADGVLNLPPERHSHGLRRLAAIESSRGSFDGAVEAVGRATGQLLGKRQVEQLTSGAACDFAEFYERRPHAPVEGHDVLVLSADGKGVVMRPEALRAATAKAAAATEKKLRTRLSKGEKLGRKRMAEVGAIYDVAPVPRIPADVMATSEDERARARPAPVAKNKWLTASVVEDAASVVRAVFDEAERRDPDHRRSWVALVDGNRHQIQAVEAEARRHKVTVTVVCDFVHVLEYLWRAAWCFYEEGDPAAEEWVRRRATSVLAGNAGYVAGAIRRRATKVGLDKKQRTCADACANYLMNKRRYLDYPTALEKGWPIATGVIEGACRHLVKDRMDLTGARWGLDGAEAVLRLRVLRSNGDFDDYWNFHLQRERQRVHESRYAGGVIPRAA
jgi:hypothetical protein